MKQGINKAELLQTMQHNYPKRLLEYVLEHGMETGIFKRKDQFLQNGEFSPHIPKNWQKRTGSMLELLKKDGWKVNYLSNYFTKSGIPKDLELDLKHFLVEQGEIIPLDEQFYWYGELFRDAVKKLREGTEREFDVGNAKEVLELSRKYMIPFLERLDAEGLTKRVENMRVWRE